MLEQLEPSRPMANRSYHAGWADAMNRFLEVTNPRIEALETALCEALHLLDDQEVAKLWAVHNNITNKE